MENQEAGKYTYHYKNDSAQSQYKYVLPHQDTANWPKRKQLLTEIISSESIKEIQKLVNQLIYLQSGRPVRMDGLAVFAQNNKQFLTDYEISLPILLNMVAYHALEVERLFPQNIDLLKQNFGGSITLSSQQILSLMAHMFYSTTSAQDQDGSFNSNTFLAWHVAQSEIYTEKFKFILLYFQKMLEEVELGINRNVTFCRNSVKPAAYEETLNDKSLWSLSTKVLQACQLDAEKYIEDFRGPSHMMVDFANMFIGGGCAGTGCVQEEILFLIFPELNVSLLFCEVMGPNEAIIMKGPRQFTSYTGYAWKTKFKGLELQANDQCDTQWRLETTIVAIDAISFDKKDDIKQQLRKDTLLRELNKAFIGFYGIFGSEQEVADFENKEINNNQIKKVVTGNWGCGVFNGTTEIKFLIQWMAASQNGREMIYSSFGGQSFCERAEKLYESLKGKTVSQLFNAICKCPKKEMTTGAALFEYLQEYDYGASN